MMSLARLLPSDLIMLLPNLATRLLTGNFLGCYFGMITQPPTSRLPPIKRINSTPTQDLLDAVEYLKVIYNPEICGSRIVERRMCSLSEPNGPDGRQTTAFSESHGSTSDLRLDEIRTDSFERSYVIRWLTALVAHSESSEDAEDSYEGHEAVINEAASLLAICAGTASAGLRSRVFVFSSKDMNREVRVQVTDQPLDNQDYNTLGAQTWGGACLLADMIIRSPQDFSLKSDVSRTPSGPLRVLELGAGTGLVGLAAAKWLDMAGIPATVVLTDFHSTVLENLQENINANFVKEGCRSLVDITSRYLDWSTYHYGSSTDIEAPFDIIFGADIIYELEHAKWLKSVVEKMLCKPPAERLDSFQVTPSPISGTSLPVPLSRVPQFHLVIPLRHTHAAESSTVEHVFPSSYTLCAEGSLPTNSDSKLQLAIVAKEVALCEELSGGGKIEEFVHYTIAWV